MSWVLMVLATCCPPGMFSLAANGPPGQDNNKKGDPLGLLYLLCNIHATCFTVFIRTGFGSEALGFPGLFALILLLLCAGADPYMMVWLALWLPALVIQRIITTRMLSKGAIIHSRYNGYPTLAMKVPFLKKEKIAMQLTEPLMCFVLGAVLATWSQFMGGFLMLGFVTLLVRGGIEHEVFHRRLTRMRDAQIEGAIFGERMR